MWFALLIGLFPALAWACGLETYSPCHADESLYSIVVDSVQTTLSRERVLLTVQQLPNHQTAAIQNLSDKPLYLITPIPDDSLPFIIRNRKKWYVQARYTSARTSCVPKSGSKKAVRNLEKIDWDCAEQRNSCGEILNSNILMLPSDSYPLGWAANGLLRGKISLPLETEQKFTQYFLCDNRIEKVAMISTLSLNEDYLKVTCDNNAEIRDCGENCKEFVNKAVAIKNPVSVPFNLTTERNDFSDLFDITLTVDGDFKDQLPEAGAMLAKHGVDVLTDIVHYGRLQRRPFDYIVYRIAREASEDITNIVGPAWSFQLKKLPGFNNPSPIEDDDTASSKRLRLRPKRAPSAFRQKSESPK